MEAQWAGIKKALEICSWFRIIVDAGATIVYAKREDIYHSRHGYKKKYNRKQRSLRLRKVFGAAGASLELDLLAKLQSS